jgi:hypothetical protein
LDGEVTSTQISGASASDACIVDSASRLRSRKAAEHHTTSATLTPPGVTIAHSWNASPPSNSWSRSTSRLAARM